MKPTQEFKKWYSRSAARADLKSTGTIDAPVAEYHLHVAYEAGRRQGRKDQIRIDNEFELEVWNEIARQMEKSDD